MGAVTQRLRRPETFAGVFVFLVVTGYLIRPNPTWAFPFYAALTPLTVWLVWREVRASSGLGGLPGWMRDPALWLGLGAAAWFGLSIAWTVAPRDDALFKYGGGWLTTSLFFVAGLAFFAHAPPRWPDRLMRFVPVAAILNALISIAFYVAAGTGGRLSGWAETRHPILGAEVMIFAGLLAVPQLGREHPPAQRLIALAALVAVTVFVVMTGSRGPLLTWLACLGVYALLTGSRRLLASAVALGAAAAAAAVFVVWGPGPEVLPGAAGDLAAAVESNVNRPSYRLEIWGAALEASAARPVIGYGVATDSAFSRAYNFPHSVYLSALYYGGAIGLALVLALFAYAAWRVLQAPGGRTRGLLGGLLALPLVAGVTDLSAIIKGPSELWYILWLPLIFIFGMTRTRQ